MKITIKIEDLPEEHEIIHYTNKRKDLPEECMIGSKDIIIEFPNTENVHYTKTLKEELVGKYGVPKITKNHVSFEFDINEV